MIKKIGEMNDKKPASLRIKAKELIIEYKSILSSFIEVNTPKSSSNFLIINE